MRGTLILVVGPSGSGKGTLISHAKDVFKNIVFPKSATTRALRGGDSDKNYLFYSTDEFKKLAEQGAFLEWAEYGGHYYGTPFKEIEPVLTGGTFALKELEVQGARQIQRTLPKEELVIIFVHAGTWPEMVARIKKRADMSEDELMKRKERYEDEISFMKEADYVIENPDGKADDAKAEMVKVIKTILERR